MKQKIKEKVLEYLPLVIIFIIMLLLEWWLLKGC